MTEKDTENAPDVIKGTTLICNKLACVLIDPSATCSFISSTFVIQNKLGFSDRDEPVMVSVPMGVSVIYDKVIRNVVIKIGDDMME